MDSKTLSAVVHSYCHFPLSLTFCLLCSGYLVGPLGYPLEWAVLSLLPLNCLFFSRLVS